MNFISYIAFYSTRVIPIYKCIYCYIEYINYEACTI